MVIDMIIRRRHYYYHPFLFLFTLLLVLFLQHSMSDLDTPNLVYKGCADKKLASSGLYKQNLKSLLASLVEKSSQKYFFTTTSGSGQNVIMGLFQCRGDITTSDCYKCVSNVPQMLEKLCGNVEAARIQLIVCYLRYEVVGFKQVPETQLMYKVCGTGQASGDDGFEERRESAFGMVENGVKSSGRRMFYSGSYQSLFVLGQCEGDLANEDCGDCVKSSEDQAKAECGDSISAQIYLHKCYISYSFYPKGVSTKSSWPGSVGQGHAQKEIAIVVGVFAALGFLVVFVLFFKSMSKKRDNKY